MASPYGAYFTPGIGSALGKIVSGTTTVATAGTAVQLTATTTPIAGVWVAMDLGSTNPLVVGDSSVVADTDSQQGILVGPAENSVFIPVNDLSLLWVDAQTNGDKLAWAYLQPVCNV